MPTRIRRPLAGLLALSLSLGAAACSDQSPAAGAPLSRQSTSAGQRVSAADTSWDYFSVDMTVMYDGGGVEGQPPLPRRGMKVRVERELDADKQWTQKITFLESPTPGRLRRPFASSAIVDSGGFRLLDGSGRAITLSPELAALMPVKGNASPSPKRAKSRDWIDNFVATPAGRGRKLARFERAWGHAASRDNGRSVHRVKRGDKDMEFVIDDALGAIVEHRVYRGASLEAQMKYTYEPMGDGAFVRRLGKGIARSSDPRGRDMAIEIRMDNLRFERRGGE